MATAEVMRRNLSLFEIEESLAMLMDDRDEVTDPEEIAAVDNAIAEYVAQEIRKVDGIRAYVRYAETMAAAANDEAQRATKIANTWKNRIERLKAACLTAMQLTGTKRIDGRSGYLLRKGNGGLAPLKVQEDILPDEYRDVILRVPLDEFKGIKEHFDDIDLSYEEGGVTASNARIREALKEGPVPGAWLEDRGEHVEVK